MITQLKIAVCDDHSSQRAYLSNIVNTWAKKKNYLIELKQYEGSSPFLFDYEEEKDYDILLLDIEMPGINGIDIAKRVRQENTTVQIIFVTGYYEYFSDGFDVSALHYLIKPVDEARLCSVLDRAVGNLQYRQRAVLITDTEGTVKVPLADIFYAEAQNVHVIVYTNQGTYRMRMTLSNFAQQLDDTFYKVHRSYIVGMKYIRKITRNEIVMTNGALIPISRGKYDEIHGALIKYL